MRELTEEAAPTEGSLGAAIRVFLITSAAGPVSGRQQSPSRVPPGSGHPGCTQIRSCTQISSVNSTRRFCEGTIIDARYVRI